MAKAGEDDDTILRIVAAQDAQCRPLPADTISSTSDAVWVAEVSVSMVTWYTTTWSRRAGTTRTDATDDWSTVGNKRW